VIILEICCHASEREKVHLSPDIKRRHKYDSVNVDLVPLCTRIKVADNGAKPLKIIQISINTQSNGIQFS